MTFLHMNPVVVLGAAVVIISISAILVVKTSPYLGLRTTSIKVGKKFAVTNPVLLELYENLYLQDPSSILQSQLLLELAQDEHGDLLGDKNVGYVVDDASNA